MRTCCAHYPGEPVDLRLSVHPVDHSGLRPVPIANPGDTAAAVTATFLLPKGPPVVKFYTVGRHCSLIVGLDGKQAGGVRVFLTMVVDHGMMGRSWKR